ncbi:MAG: hypothetical protein A2Y33_07660 [Spirochaetes bacterium GWF1_51_8]|nr:MAG: hypothetical protein A2Y33_07660 [Spirochaetes bacterium GWF1_51_8]
MRIFAGIALLFITFSPLFAEIGTSFTLVFPGKAPATPEISSDIVSDFFLLTLIDDVLFFKPLSIRYNRVYGMEVSGDSLAKSGWFFADSLMFQMSLEGRIPLGSFFIRYFIGGIVNWNVALEPLKGNIDQDLAAATGYNAAYSQITFQNNLGLGYTFGGGLGYRWSIFSFDLSVSYFSVSAPLNLSYSVLYGNEGGTMSKVDYSHPDASLVFSGFGVSLGVHVILDFAKAKEFE